MKYLSAAEILFIHSAVIDETGGSHGVRDLGLLESAAARPRQTFGGQDLHASLEEKAAALLLGLLKNHPFLDGNKRTALTAFGVFLRLNGVELRAHSQELSDWIFRLVKGSTEPKRLVAWIRAHTPK